MDELPQIDPTWVRRRPRPVQEESFLVPLLVSAVVLAVLFVLGRSYLERDNARLAAARQSKQLAAAAHQRLADKWARERARLHYLTEAEAQRQSGQGMTTSSIAGKSIHRCVYSTSSFYQTGPCKAPWVDAPQESAYSRWENVAEQAQARARAEAQLLAEQNRFAALTGQQSWAPSTYSSDSRDFSIQRCAIAKAERDRAYRLAGNQRTFNFIRHWDDVVFEACKNT
jgi:hypothetical protein